MHELYLLTMQISEVRENAQKSLDTFQDIQDNVNSLESFNHIYENNNFNYDSIDIYENEFFKLDCFKSTTHSQVITDIINYKELLKEKEEELMRKEAISQMKSKQIEFILLSTGTILLSFIGLMVFYTTGFYFIHPILYVFVFIMGIGWLATAITSVYVNKKPRSDSKCNG